MGGYPGKMLVATVVAPCDRPRLDAAADGRFSALHVNTVGEALRAVRERPVNTVLLSPNQVEPAQLAGVASLVRGFPGVSTVAIVAWDQPRSGARLLEMGACGVRKVVDLSDRRGWMELREMLVDFTTPTASRILARVVPALGEVPPECCRFFEVLVRIAPGVTTARELCRRLEVGPSTLMSRFFRARLPSPKRYLTALRLVYATGLMASPGLSIADVAYRLEYSSPQSFGRHLRSVLGITAGDFRHRYPFDVALDDFVARLVVPYQTSLSTFLPLDNGVVDLGQC